MITKRSMRLFPLVVVFLLLALNLANAQERQALRKENLDLPYDALSVDDSSYEEPPVEVVVFYGQSYEGSGVFFCLDRSRSTMDGELSIIKREVVRAIAEFSSDVQFGIVFYDIGVTKFPRNSKPVEASALAKRAATDFVNNIRVGNRDCVQKGLLESLNFAARSTAKQNMIIFLGDGNTDCFRAFSGNTDADVAYAEETLDRVTADNFRKIPIHTICVGPPGQVNESFPSRLAILNSGSYKRITR